MTTFGYFLNLHAERVGFLPKQFSVFEAPDLLMLLFKKIVSWGQLTEKSAVQKRFAQTFLDELVGFKEIDRLSIPFPDHPSLKEIAKKIINEPEDMKGLDHWANFANMSKRSFTRIFQEDVGLSLVKWRQLVKMHCALQKLHEGKTVLETAYDLGYQSPSTFTDIFKGQFGEAPRRYIDEKKAKIASATLAVLFCYDFF